MFDMGVFRFLQGSQGLEMTSPEFGEAFEECIYSTMR